MISPISINSSLDLEFDRFAPKLFCDFHLLFLLLLRAGALPFRFVRGLAFVNPRVVNYNICAAKNIVRNRPWLLKAPRRGRIHDEIDWDFVPDGHLSRISPSQNSRSQFSGLPSNLVEVSSIVEQRASVRFAGRDAEDRNSGSFPDSDNRIDGNTDCHISSDP